MTAAAESRSTGDFPLDREHAVTLDSTDPLAPLRARFLTHRAEDDRPRPIYLDGNSLGRPTAGTVSRLAHVAEQEWGQGLVRSWSHWIDLGARVGDLIGEHLLGAAAGQVVISDSTTVNLYKLAAAAIDARPGRRVIVTDDDNFPTDRYVLEGLAARHDLELRLLPTDIDAGLGLDALRAAVGPDTALVCLSHVAYRSGALLDMGAVNRIVHDAGALVLWDLCHAAGAVPVELDATAADLAVGCSYKYLNGGPGAPAFLYVRHDLQESLRQPIWGWFGRRDQFAMGQGYDPAPGLGSFLSGTPPILPIAATEEGVRVLAEAGIDRLRAKGALLTSYLIVLADAWLPELRLATPREPARRGSHVTLAHPDAWRITQALIERANVIPDYRTPDRLRLGPAPICTSFVDVWDAMDRLRGILRTRAYEDFPATPTRVT
ncbi:MAG: kynureninase [Streptosporangiales bacterium]|nr:kynureninase [Streptosporangiales bacterium]